MKGSAVRIRASAQKKAPQTRGFRFLQAIQRARVATRVATRREGAPSAPLTSAADEPRHSRAEPEPTEATTRDWASRRTRDRATRFRRPQQLHRQDPAHHHRNRRPGHLLEDVSPTTFGGERLGRPRGRDAFAAQASSVLTRPRSASNDRKVAWASVQECPRPNGRPTARAKVPVRDPTTTKDERRVLAIARNDVLPHAGRPVRSIDAEEVAEGRLTQAVEMFVRP
jgi:hypothetical protein